MISLMPCGEALMVSPMGTPSRNMRTDACPFASTQSSFTPFQHHVETESMNVATRSSESPCCYSCWSTLLFPAHCFVHFGATRMSNPAYSWEWASELMLLKTDYDPDL